MNKKREWLAIERWNNGEIPADQFLAALYPDIAKALRVRGAALTSDHKEQILRAMTAGQHPIFSSPKEFVGFVADIALAPLDLELGGIQPIIDKLLSSTRLPSKLLNYQAFVREDLRSWDEEEAEADDSFYPSGSNLISFSSPGFSPLDRGGASDLAAAIEKLCVTEPALARLAAFRLFGGLKLREIANRTSEPIAAVRRDWERLKLELALVRRNETPFLSVLSVDPNLLRAMQEHPELLRSLDWRVFERVLAEILERLGFEIELQRGTKDGGIDIFALRADSPFGAHRYIIQAKKWAGRVGIEPVRELLFLQEHHRVSKGCLATTATFSRGAWRLANEYRWRLELRDLGGLKEWLDLAVGTS